MELSSQLASPHIVDLPRVPGHIGIMMDGNGRWALQRGLPRLEGHRHGTRNVRSALDACARQGIRVVTLYVFSTENWGRPKEESDGFFKILGEVIESDTRAFHSQGVRLIHSGSLDGIPPELGAQVRRAVQVTRENQRHVLNVAFNYGGRMEILRAAREILSAGILPAALSENLVDQYLFTAGLSDMELVIRTGGEHRLSNFFPWQAARAIFYSTPTLWPDFDENELIRALEFFATHYSLPRDGSEIADT